MITNAFTCTGPYAILIMLGIKRVENRSMCPSPIKGRCAVSCSKSFCKEEFGNFVQWASRSLSADEFATLPAWCDVADWPGKIVGCVDYSCRESGIAESWNEGYRYWWDLSEVISFDQPIRCRGKTGMWEMPPSLAKQVTAADALTRTVGSEIATADDAARILRMAIPLAGMNEGLFVLPLDAENRTLSEPTLVSLGESKTTAVDPSDVLSTALKLDAKSVIIAHNHPSGNPTPSENDVEMTKELIAASKLVHLPLLDHLVLGSPDSEGGNGYISILHPSKHNA